MKSSIINIFLTSFLLLTLSGCKTIDVRGQNVDEDAIRQLENKKMTKSEVENLIGTPTIVPEYTPNTWYYVQRSLSRRAWLEPKVVEQKIVEVRFDSNDVVENVVVLNDSQKDGIQVTNEYTKTYGTEANGIQKFVRNIGRFNRTTDGKKRQKNK